VYHVYILICADASYYIGHTSDLPARLTATHRERQLKGWTRKKKEALIRSEIGKLRSSEHH